MARTKDLWTVEKDGEKVRTARYGKGKRWLAVWQAPGSVEATKAFAKKADADNYGTNQESDALRGTYIDPKSQKVTVGQWCDTWLAGYGTRRPSTVRQAKVHIAQIKKEFAGKPVQSVRPSRVREWTAKLTVAGYEPSYVYACYRRLCQIMNAAVADGLVGASPCSHATSPGGGRQRPYCATTEQVWGLYDAMPAYLRVSVLLGALAGLRIAEACGIRPGDVDLALGMVHPAVQYPAAELKTETSRTAVPVPYSLTTELLVHMAQWPGETILCDRDGNQVGPWRLERAVRAARVKVAGLPADFRFQDLRHYLASLLIASGADVKKVQARLRHASAKTTLDTYGHLWPDADESTRTALEAVFEARSQARPEQERNREPAP
ncbi:MAG: site-specific integrase [Streptosporangiaceae bacterium]